MVEGGSDLWRSPGPTFLLKQGHPEQVAQDHVQVAFEYSKQGDSMAFLGNPCQCSVIPTVKKCFVMVGPLVFQFVPIVSYSITKHH